MSRQEEKLSYRKEKSLDFTRALWYQMEYVTYDDLVKIAMLIMVFISCYLQ